MRALGELAILVETNGGPESTCDWGDCDRESVGWALDCLGSCGEPDHRAPAGAVARWLPVCAGAALVAAETAHRVILLGEVLETMNLDPADRAWRAAVIRDERALRASLAAYPARTLGAAA